MIKAKGPGLEALQVMGLGLKALTGSSESQKGQGLTGSSQKEARSSKEGLKRAWAWWPDQYYYAIVINVITMIYHIDAIDISDMW
jgi:hypothetical protein